MSSFMGDHSAVPVSYWYTTTTPNTDRSHHYKKKCHMTEYYIEWHLKMHSKFDPKHCTVQHNTSIIHICMVHAVDVFERRKNACNTTVYSFITSRGGGLCTHCKEKIVKHSNTTAKLIAGISHFRICKRSVCWI